ncbi:photosystem II manganese-stabilizing polypeptide [Phormidium tenue FACHB-886]|nr:photosystem II manganese-stabilizing polypeptide [Phormidium tenue FACHB-886]
MRYRALIAAFVAICLGLLTACSNGSPTSTAALTYEDIRNTGLANNCPQLEEVTSRGSIPIAPDQSYTITGLCLQPVTVEVKEETTKRREAQYISGKVTTRATSTIDQVSGKLKANPNGDLTFIEEDGFDFQAITVKLPNGELVPFLFTIKQLVASAEGSSGSINTSTDFVGEFEVPSYRTSNFLDPKGRGLTSGYDNAVALPSRADDEELIKENMKSFVTGKGEISLQVSKVNNTTGEIAGTFQSIQPSDTDMGGKPPVDVRIRGSFYARVEQADV